MNKIDPDQPKSVGKVLEEGTRVDHPESVMSNEDIPQTNSKFEFNYSPSSEARVTSENSLPSFWS